MHLLLFVKYFLGLPNIIVKSPNKKHPSPLRCSYIAIYSAKSNCLYSSSKSSATGW